MITFGALMGFFLLSGALGALPAHVVAPLIPVVPSHTVTLTAYNAVKAQTDDDPLVTASGVYSNPEIIAARSRDLADELPFGTIIEIDATDASKEACGYDIVAPIVGYRVIADTMNPRYTDRIDILFSTKSNYTLKDGRVKNAGMVLGICNGVTIRVVGHIDLTNPKQLPKTQAELARIVRGDDNALAIK